MLKGKVSTLEAKEQEKKKSSEEKKIEYARSAYLNARRPHVKSGIEYKNGVKHNARENNKGKVFIKFTKEGNYQKKLDMGKTTNHKSCFAHNIYANASNSTCKLFHDFDASYVLMKNKFGRVIAKYVGPRNETCVQEMLYDKNHRPIKLKKEKGTAANKTLLFIFTLSLDPPYY